MSNRVGQAALDKRELIREEIREERWGNPRVKWGVFKECAEKVGSHLVVGGRSEIPSFFRRR